MHSNVICNELWALKKKGTGMKLNLRVARLKIQFINYFQAIFKRKRLFFVIITVSELPRGENQLEEFVFAVLQMINVVSRSRSIKIAYLKCSLKVWAQQLLWLMISGKLRHLLILFVESDAQEVASNRKILCDGEFSELRDLEVSQL